MKYVLELARIPRGICAVSYENDSGRVHEASRLALETAKSRQLLNIEPRWPLDQAVGRTMAWYAAHRGTVRGIHPLDPRRALAWPLPVGQLSPRDAGQAFLAPNFEGVRL